MYIKMYVRERERERDREREREPREEVGVVELEGLRSFENRTESELIFSAKNSAQPQWQCKKSEGLKEGFGWRVSGHGWPVLYWVWVCSSPDFEVLTFKF